MSVDEFYWSPDDGFSSVHFDKYYGTISVHDGYDPAYLKITPEAAISLASKLLQYGTQAYRYPKRSDD